MNKLQIIEIHINKEKDEPNSNIINKDFQEQLKDSKKLKIFLDGKKKLDFNLVYKKGKHKIIIIFNKNIKSCKLFNFCNDIIEIKFINFITKDISDMSFMFQNCSKLTNLNLSNFNTENVNNMSYMFNECSNLINLDISNFKTNKVEDMRLMFQNCSKLTNLNFNNFNTKNVKNINKKFNEYSNLSNFKFIKFNSNNFKEMRNIQYTNSLNLAQNKFKTENLIMSNKNKKYTLFNIIGKGGFGICYMAKDENNKIYAIKKIIINNENSKDVINEINILKIMNSKYSVEFIDSIEKDDNIYIVMELCDGNLNDLLKKKMEI